jgi:hypothetical protein
MCLNESQRNVKKYPPLSLKAFLGARSFLMENTSNAKSIIVLKTKLLESQFLPRALGTVYANIFLDTL